MQNKTCDLTFHNKTTTCFYFHTFTNACKQSDTRWFLFYYGMDH